MIYEQIHTNIEKHKEETMTGLEGIIKFQKDRMLDKMEYNHLNEATNIIEEVLEGVGVRITKDDREEFKEDVADFISKMTCKYPTNSFLLPEDKVDYLADIIVFSAGAIMKLGYNPECVLQEVSKEINSRVGKIVDGKFQKDLSEEAKANWYKADYSKCKMEDK